MYNYIYCFNLCIVKVYCKSENFFDNRYNLLKYKLKFKLKVCFLFLACNIC